MAQTQEDFELSKDVHSHANFDVNGTFINSLTIRKNLFTADQEIYIDSQHPLILLNDTNVNTPLPPFCQPIQQKTIEKRQATSQVLSELDLESPGLKKSSSRSHSHSHSRKSVLRTKPSSPSRRRDPSDNDSKGRRPSNSMSNARSDTVNGKEVESEPASPSKDAMQQEEVDIFDNKGENNIKESNPILKKKLRDFLDSTSLNIFIGLITIYALFAQDFSVAVFEESADLGFDVTSLIVMGIFAAEMVLTIYAKKEYFLSFFFWLDLISTVSIILDVGFIFDDVLYGGDEASSQRSPASEVVAKRIGRIFRVVRLVRLVKLYKQVLTNREIREARKQQQQVGPGSFELEHVKSEFSLKKAQLEMSFDTRRRTSKRISSILDKSAMSPLKGRRSESRSPDRRESRVNPLEGDISKNLGESNSVLDISAISRRKSRRLSRAHAIIAPKEAQPVEPVKESRVGKQLSELTTKRVIVIVLALLLFVPMFDSDFFFDSPDSQAFQMDMIKSLIDSNVPSDAIDNAINIFIDEQKDNDPQLIYFSKGDQVLFSVPDVDPNDLRSSESSIIALSTIQGELFSIVSDRYQSQFDAWLSIGRTLFICFLLSYAAIAFNHDAKELIIKPLERIIQKVNKIAKNPLLAKDEEIVRDQSKGFENETIHIENAIVKIGGLLALGFGDAGSAIIAQNLAKSGDINPMLPGKRKAAIYGFCDIRNFTDATEILQEDVMVFVNSIADIVHSLVDKYAGAANKNIGDAFLLVWKFPEDAVVEMADGQLEVISSQITTNIADCALISFLKIYARINRDPAMLAYRENPLLNSRLPNYKVKMGFGLHLGWAIEGAIGSEFKIDASYLSPNVNMSSRLEAATKQYGVPLLFSGDLFEMLSDGLQDISRLIDVVTVKGSIKPIELYTVDMDIEDISIAKDRANQSSGLRKTKQKQKKQFILDLIENDSASNLLETDKELKHILRNKDEEFDGLFSVAFDAYVDGDWSVAKKKFDACLAIRKDDGPTKTLISFLAEYDFICPEEWDGYRVLTEK